MHAAKGDIEVSTAGKRYGTGESCVIGTVVLFGCSYEMLCRNRWETADGRGGMECRDNAAKGGCARKRKVGAEMQQLSCSESVEWRSSAGASCCLEPLGNVGCYDMLLFSVFFGPRCRGQTFAFVDGHGGGKGHRVPHLCGGVFEQDFGGGYQPMTSAGDRDQLNIAMGIVITGHNEKLSKVGI